MAVDVGSAVGYLDLDIAGFLKGLKSAQDEADKTTENIAGRMTSAHFKQLFWKIHPPRNPSIISSSICGVKTLYRNA